MTEKFSVIDIQKLIFFSLVEECHDFKIFTTLKKYFKVKILFLLCKNLMVIITIKFCFKKLIDNFILEFTFLQLIFRTTPTRILFDILP